MTELKIFYKLQNAFEVSTLNYNAFIKAINSIAWDSKFFADDEYCFVKGSMMFSTTSLNPFEVTRNPDMIFSDGSYKEICIG